METEKKKYKRIMLKLSGEALANDKGFGIDPEVVYRLAGELKKPVIPELKSLLLLAAEISGEALKEVPAVWIGYLPITWACLPLSSTLWHSRMPSKKLGVTTRVQTAIEMQQIAEPYIRRRAIRQSGKEESYFGAGTGNPYFTTDTTAALRSAEIEADVMLMAKKQTNGVYDADPKFHPEAKMFTHLSYNDVLQKKLEVMDNTAITLCMNNKIPIMVFNIDVPGNIVKACEGENLGTLIEEK